MAARCVPGTMFDLRSLCTPSARAAIKALPSTDVLDMAKEGR